jgi:choline dehydrogenase
MFSMMASIGKPVGHGRIRWPSLKAGAKPEIESRFLDDARDRSLAVDGLMMARELWETGAMRDLAKPIWPRAGKLRSRAAIEARIRKLCDSGYHLSGTVPMGPDSNPLAPLDGRGRVRGVKGLYVADASIMPTIPSSNTHLPTLMIGERFGEWLRTME